MSDSFTYSGSSRFLILNPLRNDVGQRVVGKREREREIRWNSRIKMNMKDNEQENRREGRMKKKE